MNQQEFRNEMAALPPITIKNKWDKHRMALRNHAKNEAVADFTKWSTVNATMFIGNAPYVDKELDVLQSLVEWQDRWVDAIEDPGVGNPETYGMWNASGNFIHAALCIHRWETMTGLRFSWMHEGTIFEFGGGYGANCYIMHRLGFQGSYYMFDLPEFSLLQQYYLSNVDLTPIPSAEERFREIYIEHRTALTERPHDYGIFVSNAALSEVDIELRDAILDNAKAEHYLIVFQGIWDDINNVDYFRDFATYLGHNPDHCIQRLEPTGIHWMCAI